MAISTYAELKSAVADWLHRSDLDGVIPDFVALAEDRLRADLAGYLEANVGDLPALSDSNTSNMLLEAAPSLYLWSALAQAAAYTGSDERVALWEAKYRAAVTDFLSQDWTGSGGVLRTEFLIPDYSPRLTWA